MPDAAHPAFDIERYLNIRSAYGASFAPDGTLAFLMNTTGVPQVWTLDAPGQWPEQQTFYDERVTFASWSPERPELAFGMDEGGNERQQLFVLTPGTGEIRPLTAMPEAKHRWGGWSHDGEQVAFTSNRRDESVFDVYVQSRTAQGEEARLVTEGDGWLTLSGWSPDDTRLLVSQAYSNVDQDVSVLDIESGELQHLTPHEGTVRYTSASWGPDGDNVYLVTDEGDADTLYLARIELSSGELTPVEVASETDVPPNRNSPDGDWEVDGVAIDHDSRRVVFSRNVDGYTELTMGELTAPGRIDPRPTPDLPHGTAGGVSFDDAGDRFAVGASAPTENTNVFVVDSRTGETERWTRAPTAGIPRDTFVSPELVHYPTFDGREIPAYFSVPDVEGTVPVIVDIHGGPESQRRPSFSSTKQYFCNHGYAVFEPNVRGSSGYGKAYGHLDDVEKRMDSVRDIQAAVEWLHDHPAVDPDRIVALGGSYGGFMVLAALTEYPDLWAAGIDIVGIANFVTFLENTGDWRRKLREAEYGSLAENRAFLEEISPLNNIEHIEAPLFVLHGANDPRVPVGEAHQIVEGAREQGVPVRELVFEDEGHGFSKLENRIDAYSQIVDFLDEHV